MKQLSNQFPLLRPLKTNNHSATSINWFELTTRKLASSLTSIMVRLITTQMIISSSTMHMTSMQHVTRLRTYDRYDNTAIATGKLQGRTIVNYYYNHLCSMSVIYASLDLVFACEIKPLKLNFRISCVFEVSDMFDGYTYAAEQIYLNINTDNKPIINITPDDLKLINEYINATLIQYKISSSSKLLSIVETFMFQVAHMLHISGKVKVLLDVFIKSKSIIVGNEDDRLCWYRFIALCLYPELHDVKIFTIKHCTQRAKLYYNFIKYDFETFEKIINNQILTSTQLNSTLIHIC